jgi:hypothetical protein
MDQPRRLSSSNPRMSSAASSVPEGWPKRTEASDLSGARIGQIEPPAGQTTNAKRSSFLCPAMPLSRTWMNRGHSRDFMPVTRHIEGWIHCQTKFSANLLTIELPHFSRKILSESTTAPRKRCSDPHAQAPRPVHGAQGRSTTSFPLGNRKIITREN